MHELKVARSQALTTREMAADRSVYSSDRSRGLY